jgi:phosphotransacetylase
MEMATSQLEDNVVLGTMMVALGEVDGLVSGAVHSTGTYHPARTAGYKNQAKCACCFLDLLLCACRSKF